MKHKNIQKKFLLYIDGDLSEVEKIFIDQHLDECADCKRHFEELAKIWNKERTLEQPLPSQALWYDLKDRMEKESLKKVSAATTISNVKLLLNTAITVVVVVFAVFVGSKFGTALNIQGSSQSKTHAYSENSIDEFGMSYFDTVPPNSIAKDLFVTPTSGKGLQK